MAEAEKKEDWGGGPRRDVIAGEEQRLSSQKPLSAATCCEGSPFASAGGTAAYLPVANAYLIQP